MAKSYKLLLKQSIGVPAAPIVKIGASVKKGTLLAQPDGLGVPLHASVSGKVTEITDTYIMIEADPVQTDEFEPIPQSDSIAEMVKAAGLCGMGGAGFPTYVKLGTKLDGGSIMVNAAECEPGLKHNIKQIITEPEKIRRGILLSMQATGAAKGILGVKAKNAEAIAAFRKVIQPGDNIEIAELADMYPMGEERALIREVSGTLLGVDQLPAAANAVILNLETVARIAEAVDQRRPIISKNITVLGKLKNGRESQIFMDVPIGTPVSELIEMGGGIDGSYGEIIMGGPFTGKPTALDAPVMKNTGGIIVTIDYPKETRPVGLLVCACGGNEDRLRQVAEQMQAKVVGVQKCKQAHEVKGALKCENPGNCPGQAEKIMELKKAGAQVVLCSNCSDCTNTVMCVAPKLKMAVHHQTDTAMRTIGHSLFRRLPIEQ
ncbi:proline reductase-associated electron transfer protein PrdC [Desulfovibrio sp. OttesenSCG-928-C06]|nr:proline reductase-associated electron transfer protein PrdC [Desulfovibrio sp. OttesenSCG-928-C06]